ncbi:MAG: FG-GAP-like repeat-containing protein [Bryobacteraceae bacterium]|jgi:tetratricopeptide (TPR) repeat protein
MKTLVPCAIAVMAFFLQSPAQTKPGVEEQLAQLRNLGKAFYENPVTKQEAVDTFRKALALAPDSARERLNYGLALVRNGDVDQGAAEIARVQKQDPSIPHTWFNLGILYKKKGEMEEALKQLRHMEELVPDEPVTHYNVGTLYKQNGNMAEALKEFETAAKLDINFAAPRFQIFDLYRQQGAMDKARPALAEFQEVKKRQEASDSGSEDVSWSYYSEIYDVVEPEPATAAPPASELKFAVKELPGKADPNTAGMLVLDTRADGRADLLVWSSAGVHLYHDGAELPLGALADLKGVISISAGDYNNDGFVDLCVLTADGPVLYRNDKGTFHKDPAKLPAGRFTKAVWIDYDHDYDLDLMLLGNQPVLLRNDGEKGWEDRTKDFPFVAGSPVDAVAFRVVHDTRCFDVLVSYHDRVGVLYRDQLGGIYRAQSLTALPTGATNLIAGDVDNNQSLDILYRGSDGIQLLENTGTELKPGKSVVEKSAPFVLADLENRGVEDLIGGGEVRRNLGRRTFGNPLRPEPLGDVAAIVAADFNRDGRVDAAIVTGGGNICLLTNQTPLKANWVALHLEGVKNLKAGGPGAEVEVKSGTLYQKKLYTSAPLVFGLGGHKEIDTVRITWPSGLIQNEMQQPLNKLLDVKEAPRLSGSCPMIYTWDGAGFRFLTDVLGVAPLGASSGDGRYFPVDHDEYVQIPGDALVPVDGRYRIRITEELSEVSYLDQVRLVAVDHPASTEIFSNDKWKSPPFPEFRLFGVERRVYPVRARDDRGRDVRDALLRRDRRYVDGFERNYAGVAREHALELDFGSAAPENRAVLVLNGWVDWADGSTFLAASQGGGGLQPPYLQVKDAQGRWKTVIEDMGMPSGKTKTIAVDLTARFLSASREVRIVTSLCVYWDEIFLGEDSRQPEARLTPLDAGAATLAFHGFSHPTIHPQRLQPEAFDYQNVATVSNWNPTPGLYTRYGDVRELVTAVDDKLVVMGSGDELKLEFGAVALPPLPAGWTRDFLLLVDGWAKDRDANTAFSQTVDPLPFHAMSSYPYPAGEHYPEDADHAAYRRKYNTRPALKLLRPLVAAAR